MDNEAQLKIQAYLDGELADAEAREVANWLARDQGAVALMTELRQTRKALAGFENGIRLPESREFYWSKIRRQIERERVSAPQPAARVPWLVRLRYFLVPAAGLALVGFIAYLGLPGTVGTPGVETTLADSGAFTYHDYNSGTTLVWLSYPAENESPDTEELGSTQ